MTRPTKTPDSPAPPPDPAELAKTLAPADLVVSTTRVDTRPEPDVVEPLATGSRIGRFLLLDKLGEGGMGVVFAARDEQLDRKIAIKLLLPGMKQGRERLLREARALARLTHPNVVTVHDVGTIGERVYVAMEFVEGVTLTAWLAESRGWEQVLDVFLQAADGLAAAHDAGIVHRDFKPDNVLVGTDGRVRVLDFGLAKGGGLARDSVAEQTATDPTAPLEEQNLTQTGALMGTPAYMAPEQFLGSEIDARTDQFAFCITLYEGLHGVRPFAGTTLADLARAVTQGLMIPTPRERPIPPAVHRVLERGLSPQREGRFSSMHDLRRALARAASQVTRRTNPRWPAVLGLAALLGVSGVGIWLYVALDRDVNLRGAPSLGRAEEASPEADGSPEDAVGPSKHNRVGPDPQTPPSRPGSPTALLPLSPMGDSPDGAVPLPSVTDCPPHQPPPRAPGAAQHQLELLTTAMSTQPLQGAKLLETLSSLVEHHQRNDDDTAACAVAQRFLTLAPTEHPGRWDMMCLERQLDCRSRLDRAKIRGSAAWTRVEEVRAPDSTLGGPSRDRQMRAALDALEQACHSGHAASCLRAAAISSGGDKSVADPSKGRALYQRACRMGELDGCIPLRKP